MACKKCVPHNVCKVKDDFPELAEKIKKAKALIIGAYIPYGQMDGFTKALLERFWYLDMWIIFKWVGVVPEGSKGQGFNGSSDPPQNR